MKKLIFVSLALIFFSSTSPALAASFEPQQKNFLIRLSPGSKSTATVLIKNLSATTQTLSLNWEGYRLPEKEVYSATEMARHSIDFATISPAVLTLTPFAQASAQIAFNPPLRLPSADYYGSLAFTNQNQETSSTDFTLRILGKDESNLEILSANDDGQSVSLEIVNKGNNGVSVSPKLSIKGLLGQNKEVPADDLNIKAGQRQSFSISHPKLGPGFYQEALYLSYNNQTQSVEDFNSFWIHPEIFVLAALLGLSLLTVVYFLTLKHD